MLASVSKRVTGVESNKKRLKSSLAKKVRIGVVSRSRGLQKGKLDQMKKKRS